MIETFKLDNGNVVEIEKKPPTKGMIGFLTAAYGKWEMLDGNFREAVFTQWEILQYVSREEDIDSFLNEALYLQNLYSFVKADMQSEGFYIFDRIIKDMREEQPKYIVICSSATHKYLFQHPKYSYTFKLTIKRKLNTHKRALMCINKEGESPNVETDRRKILVVDTETTGLDNMQDEILQVSIIDVCGNVVYNKYFKPKERTEWKEAEAVNGITPEMVQDAPYIESEKDTLNKIFATADTVIGYNTSFDIQFLWASGIKTPSNIKYVDVMQDFAPIYGEWSEKHQDYKYKSLGVCAQYYGFDWDAIKEKVHNSLGDCYATLFCYKKIHQKG